MKAVLPDFVPDFNSDAEMERWRQEYDRLNPKEDPMPLCPVHQVEMKPSRGGGFYCSQKTGPGPKDYCTEKVKAATPPATPTPAPTSIATPTVDYTSTELAAECMKFLTSISGCPEDVRAALIQEAVETYKAFKAVM